MKRRHPYLLLLAGSLFLGGPAGALQFTEWIIGRAEWPTYVNSHHIGTLPSVREVLARFEEKAPFRIIVRYPGGQAGSEWADTLVHWFVAHGVPGDYVRKELGAGHPDRLLLVLVSER